MSLIALECILVGDGVGLPPFSLLGNGCSRAFRNTFYLVLAGLSAQSWVFSGAERRGTRGSLDFGTPCHSTCRGSSLWWVLCPRPCSFLCNMESGGSASTPSSRAVGLAPSSAGSYPHPTPSTSGALSWGRPSEMTLLSPRGGKRSQCSVEIVPKGARCHLR